MRRSILLGLLSVFWLPSVLSSQNKAKTDSLTRLLPVSANDSVRIEILNQLSDEFMSSVPEKAFEYANSALLLAEKRNDRAAIAHCLNEIGVINFDKGAYKEAVGYYFEALKINEDIGDKNEAASNLINIGNVYRKQENIEKAMKYNLSALDIYESLGNKTAIAISQTNLGNIYLSAKNETKALKYYQLALRMFTSLSDQQHIATVLNDIGVVYLNRGEYAKAIDNFNRANKLYELSDDKLGIAYIDNNIGEIYLKQGNFKKAIEYYSKSAEFAKLIGAKDMIEYNYESLSQIAEKTGNYKQAYDYYRLSSDIKDTLLNAQVIKQVDEMAIKYETEKKEKENAILKKEAAKQQFQNERQRRRVNFLIIGLIIISAAGIVLFIRSRSKQKTNEFLKELVDLKTQEEEELRKAKNAVEQSMKLKEQFLANISHEIRTPLNAVIGFTDLLYKGNLRSSEKEYIHYIKTAGESLVNIVNDILDMSKIEARMIIFEEKNH